MATEHVLDFERLLAPVSEDSPSGIELRTDPEGSVLFFQVKESREAARTAERQLMHWYGQGEKPEAPNWRPVIDQAQRILTQESKDLWVCAWLLEALVRVHGFAGLRDGMRLIGSMCQQYWLNIHPSPDEDGYAYTVSQLTGVFEGALAEPIHAIPITPETPSQRALSYADYTDACALEKLDAKTRGQRLEQGAATREMFDRVVQPNHADFFRNLSADIDRALHEFTELADQLEQRCGVDDAGYSAAPPTTSVREAITTVRDLVGSLTRELLKDPAVDEQEAEAGSESSDTKTEMASGTSGTDYRTIRNRDDAFRALQAVADYFRRTEPHSPVSYSLEQAVRWGRLPFPELMSELIANEDVRRDMLRRAGVSDQRPGKE